MFKPRSNWILNWITAALAVLILLIPLVASVVAVENNQNSVDISESTLALQQEQIANKYDRLEALLLRMADVDAATHPRRAAVLRRAVAQCNERHLRHQLDILIGLLTDDDLDRAVDRQKNVQQDLRALLDLLLKEDRSRRLQDEQARMRAYIKEIERLLRRQRGLQARTEGGDSTDVLAEQQAQLSQRTGDLGQQMKENEEGSSTSKEGDSPHGSSEGDTESADKEEPDHQDSPTPSDGKNQEKESPQENQQKSNGSDGENSRPQDQGQPPSDSGQQKPGQQEPGQPGQSGEPGHAQDQNEPDSPESQPFKPRQRVEQARRRMEKALEELRKQNSKEATEDQQKAQEELRKAIAELEEILRQTREEEVERMLAMLEARFRKMLQLQLSVYEQTQQLDKVTADQRGFDFDIQAGQLGFEERKIIIEADRTLTLLEDEGSSIAFPEVVGQVRDDMLQVAERLAASKVSQVTQGIEQDIIAALEEMIEALQREQKRGQTDGPQSPPGRPPGDDDRPLVDILAELRMIRSMENRIYQRTKRYANMLDNAEDLAGQAVDPDLSSAIRKLGKRQKKIHQITRDLYQGKNR
ncbi:MAG: hypothetical protein MK179_14430 [Pirellulaceae bacterium]|nr:hypothetical protein [Pirellulaceae bacterium]